jgi:hypothetical protein
VTQKIADFFEVFLFFLLTLWVYALFILTVPIAEDPHGWIALNGFDKPLWLGWVHWFIFGSALVCALLGVLMMKWVPVLTPDMVRNLWIVTYFFIWIDTVFALSMEYQTTNFLLGFLMGLLFLFLFFYLIGMLGYTPHTETYVPDWKSQLVHYWNWGWMSFYFSLSLLLAYNSIKYSDSRMPFCFGALVVCFFNYAFTLFLNRAEGKGIEEYSKKGRIFFGAWLGLLVICLLGQKWIF